MNLANLTLEEKDKINVELAASSVAYKERLNMYESLGVTRTYLLTNWQAKSNILALSRLDFDGDIPSALASPLFPTEYISFR